MTMLRIAGHGVVHVGDVFTLDVDIPDRRWWPRLRAALLRQAPPTIRRRVAFRITETTTS